MNSVRSHVLVCVGSGCVASGALEVSAALEEAVEKHGLAGEIKVVGTGCLGPCAVGPVAVVYPEGVFYQGIKPEDAETIVTEHLIKGRVVERLVHKGSGDGSIIPALEDVPYFRKQVKIVLRNCGIVDPQKIEDYIARDGYQGLAKALTSMTPEQVVAEMKASGLRGRGGAGFLTGLKWEFANKTPGDVKYVLCNGDEGDPGAFMDRSVLEGDPHSVIEGMAIAGYAIGAREGFAYIRAEYPLAIERFEHALNQARDFGLLGENIFGSKFSFSIDIRKGSGAFVCGEETALMRSIEGKRGEPRPRPPFPAQRGLWEKPSVLNNVETLANVPAIMLNGAAWYGKYGTAKSKGTKVFALAGAVNNTGLVEVPIGMSLGEIIYDIGGGIRKGKTFKAAQIGGPSGGCIPREHLNVPMDYEPLAELGAIMGSGGLIVMDEDTCMVDMARFFLEFVQEESCGKCAPCRIGTKRMLEILDRICSGRGEEGDIERLEELSNRIKDTALCGLGQTAPNPVLSTIRHFRHEYEAHIRDKKCAAGICSNLFRAPCANACPAGVNVPGYLSLIGEKRYAEALKLHRENNPFAAVCARVCFHPCENKCRRSMLDDPVSVRALKRFMADQEVTVQTPDARVDDANAARKVAIIGAGPAGMSCAYFLARLGYLPRVFEAEAKAGGMLAQGIPAYRLPREILEREIRMIQRLGVDIETGRKLGRDFTLQSLRDEGFEAVFMAVGVPQGIKLGIPGEKLPGVLESMDLLRDYNMTGKAAVGRKVVVIGGGNAAIDAARTAHRLGAASVTIVYRRTRDEMPAWGEEIEEAEREGVRMRMLAAPIEIIARDGKVAGVKCQAMKLGDFDRSGRRRPEPKPDGEFTLDADMVVAAIGQRVELAPLLGGLAVKVDARGRMIANPANGQTSVEWLFAGGDLLTGPSSVTEAIGGGERAAAGIDKFLSGKDRAFWRKWVEVDTAFDPDADPVAYPRAKVQMLAVARRRGCFAEVEIGITESVALREAKRCLRCDYREIETHA